MRPAAYSEARQVLIWTVGLSYVLMVLCLLATKVSLDYEQAAHAYVAAIPVPALLYAYWRRIRPIDAALETLIAAFLLTIPSLVWTYAGMSLALPLADANLIAMDKALHFDWWSFITYVDHRLRLARMLGLAYGSFSIQYFLLPMWLAISGSGVRACALLFSYALLCLFSTILGAWYPALGTYVAYGVGNGDLANINAKFGFFFLDQFHAVRDQHEFALRIGQAAGIVTFPSVHAGVAGLCAWAAWDSRVLRYPLLVLNILMATSAVSHANHYLVDVIAGLGIAALTISIATSLFYRASAAGSFVSAGAEMLRLALAGQRRAITPAGSPAAVSD